MNGARILAVCGLAVGVTVSTLTDTKPSREPITVDGYQVLSGDFHIHAFVGDGGIAPWMMQDNAAHLGLDVIAITNHNQTFAGRLARSAAEPSSTGSIVLVGEEITGRNYHLIGVGIERPINWDQPARGAIADVHAQGGLAIAAHPMHGFDGYDPEALADLDGVEVAHRDTLAPEAGKQWDQFYERAMARNPEIAAIGSSDFHTSGPMGLCRTYLFVRERSQAGVMDAIRDGRTVGRCESSRLRGRPELVRLLEPYRDALAPPDETLAQTFALLLAWVSLVAIAIVGPRS
ncbi:MAG TPA: CehA/McbA family metallohydrolase [Vicinamibacterales bacterium]